jgi:hypothetical protein
VLESTGLHYDFNSAEDDMEIMQDDRIPRMPFDILNVVLIEYMRGDRVVIFERLIRTSQTCLNF